MWLGHRLSNLRAAWGPPTSQPYTQLESTDSGFPSFPSLHSSGHSSHSCTDTCIVLGEQKGLSSLHGGAKIFASPFLEPSPTCALPVPPLSPGSAATQCHSEEIHSLHRAACLTSPLPCSCQLFPLLGGKLEWDWALASSTPCLLHFSPPLYPRAPPGPVLPPFCLALSPDHL